MMTFSMVLRAVMVMMMMLMARLARIYGLSNSADISTFFPGFHTCHFLWKITFQYSWVEECPWSADRELSAAFEAVVKLPAVIFKWKLSCRMRRAAMTIPVALDSSVILQCCTFGKITD